MRGLLALFLRLVGRPSPGIEWAGATPRTFWAAGSRKSGVAPAHFRNFSDATFASFPEHMVSVLFRLTGSEGEEVADDGYEE